VDEDFAKSLTNLGICIPDAGMVATEPGKACDLDAAFADMKRDPMSPVAGRVASACRFRCSKPIYSRSILRACTYGVIAYQPTYPLWTDDAGKLRYIRVRAARSVKYDKDSKTFDIPENTRFYKTFLKKVIALDGKERYRKDRNARDRVAQGHRLVVRHL